MPPKGKNPPGQKPTKADPDDDVSRTAARQWGAFTGRQARAAGLSQHQIDHRVEKLRPPPGDGALAA